MWYPEDGTVSNQLHIHLIYLVSIYWYSLGISYRFLKGSTVGVKQLRALHPKVPPFCLRSCHYTKPTSSFNQQGCPWKLVTRYVLRKGLPRSIAILRMGFGTPDPREVSGFLGLVSWFIYIYNLFRGLTTSLYTGYNPVTKYHGHPRNPFPPEVQAFRKTWTEGMETPRISINIKVWEYKR